jgi:hypothetical protein
LPLLIHKLLDLGVLIHYHCELIWFERQFAALDQALVTGRWQADTQLKEAP